MELHDLAVQLTDTDARCKSNTRRIDKLEERQDNLDKLVTAVATLDTKMETTSENVGELKEQVKRLVEKPAERASDLWDKIIWGVVGAVLAYLIGKILV